MSERLAPVLGFVAIVAAVVGALTVAAHVVRKAAEAVKLGGVDRLAGGLFGGLRAAFGPQRPAPDDELRADPPAADP